MKGEEAEESCGRGRGGDCLELKAGFQRMETGVQRKGRERAVTRKRAWSPATPGLFPLLLLLRARGRKTPVSSALPSFWFLCFLETGTGPKAASTSTSVQYQEVAPQRPRPHSHGDSDLTETRPGWGCSAHAGTRRVTIRVRQEGTLVQHDSVFGVVFRRRESDTRRAIYLGLLKHTTIHPSWEKASWR